MRCFWKRSSAFSSAVRLSSSSAGGGWRGAGGGAGRGAEQGSSARDGQTARCALQPRAAAAPRCPVRTCKPRANVDSRRRGRQASPSAHPRSGGPQRRWTCAAGGTPPAAWTCAVGWGWGCVGCGGERRGRRTVASGRVGQRGGVERRSVPVGAASHRERACRGPHPHSWSAHPLGGRRPQLAQLLGVSLDLAPQDVEALAAGQALKGVGRRGGRAAAAAVPAAAAPARRRLALLALGHAACGGELLCPGWLAGCQLRALALCRSCS